MKWDLLFAVDACEPLWQVAVGERAFVSTLAQVAATQRIESHDLPKTSLHTHTHQKNNITLSRTITKLSTLMIPEFYCHNMQEGKA